MSGFELNKIMGAILSAALLVMVIGIIGDVLVHPKQHTSSVVVADAPAPAPQKEEKIDPIGPLLAAANVEAGKKQANKCAACHTFDKGGKSKLGPPLWDIVSRNKAAVDEFKYSPAMVKKEGTWNYESLNIFIVKPRSYVPGTKMVFAGIRKPSDRANLIAYLRSLSDQPKPLP